MIPPSPISGEAAPRCARNGGMRARSPSARLFLAILVALGASTFASRTATAQSVRPLPPTHPVSTLPAPLAWEVDRDSLRIGEVRELSKNEALVRFRVRALPLAQVEVVRNLSVGGHDLTLAPLERLEPRVAGGWAGRNLSGASPVYCTVRGGAVTGRIRNAVGRSATRARLCLVDDDRDRLFEAAFLDGIEAAELQRLHPISPVAYRSIPNDSVADQEYVNIHYDGLPIQNDRFRAEFGHSVKGRRSSYNWLLLDSGEGYCAYNSYFFVRYDPAGPSIARLPGVDVEIISLDRAAGRLKVRILAAKPIVRAWPTWGEREVPLHRDRQAERCV